MYMYMCTVYVVNYYRCIHFTVHACVHLFFVCCTQPRAWKYENDELNRRVRREGSIERREDVQEKELSPTDVRRKLSKRSVPGYHSKPEKKSRSVREGVGGDVSDQPPPPPPPPPPPHVEGYNTLLLCGFTHTLKSNSLCFPSISVFSFSLSLSLSLSLSVSPPSLSFSLPLSPPLSPLLSLPYSHSFFHSLPLCPSLTCTPPPPLSPLTTCTCIILQKYQPLHQVPPLAVPVTTMSFRKPYKLFPNKQREKRHRKNHNEKTVREKFSKNE